MEDRARRRLALLCSHFNPPAEASLPSCLSASNVNGENGGKGGNDCVFCKIIHGEAPALKLYEDDECLCILDTYPLCHGLTKSVRRSLTNCCISEGTEGVHYNAYMSKRTRHSLIIPKNHFPSLDATPPSIIGAMCSKVPLISNAVMKATGCDSFNLLVNNGAAAGQVVYHTHIHIIPRKAQDCLWTSESIRRRPLKVDQEASRLADRVRESLAFANVYEDSKGQGSSTLVAN